MPAGAQPELASRPNVLVIYTDDQRHDSLKYMPKTKGRLGGSGVTYKSATVTTPLCCPSRATLFSGRYVHNHEVVHTRLTPDYAHDQTMQGELQAAGYRTAISGKYFNNWSAVLDHPLRFDRYRVWRRGTYFDSGYFDDELGDVVIPGYSTNVTARRIRDWWREWEKSDDDQPWLTFWTPKAPHLPAAPHPKYADTPITLTSNPAQGESNLSDKPSWVRVNADDDSTSMGKRRDMVRTLLSVDDQVERLVNTLDALNELDNTLIFFASDNGYLWGEHRLDKKRYPYDESVRIPFIVRWDDHFEGGEVERRTYVQNLDIAPTVYQAAGIEPNYQVDGHSLMEGINRSWAFLEHFRGRPTSILPAWRALWRRRETFIRYPDVDQIEGYRATDPWQLRNVYGDSSPSNDFPNTVALLELVDRLATCVGEECHSP